MYDETMMPQQATALALSSIGLGTHRYKAAMHKVAPASATHFGDKGNRAMLGVSLGNANFEGARLEASLEWISERYDHCALVLGDSVYRLTLMLLEGICEEDARIKALAAGQEFAREWAPLLRQFSGRCTFEILPFSQIEGREGFAGYRDALHALSRDNAEFGASVEAFADLYLGRGDKLDNPYAVDAETAGTIARDYLLEEAALFCLLQEDGWPVLIYPGSIDSIADLCEGRFPGTPEPLTRLAFLSLALRKRGLYFADGSVKVVRTALGGDLPGEAQADAFMDQCSDADWATLLKVTKIRKFAPREAILTAEEGSRHLYILESGRAEVSIRLPDGSQQRIAIIEQGSVFGEQAFLDGQPRSAMVTALSDCELRSLAWKDFRGLMERRPDIACQLLLDIGRVLSLRARRQLRELQHLP